MVKAQLKDFNGAIADFSMVIEINPKDADAYYNRGMNKKELKNLKGAISDLTFTIGIEPKYTTAYYNRGLLKNYNRSKRKWMFRFKQSWGVRLC